MLSKCSDLYLSHLIGIGKTISEAFVLLSGLTPEHLRNWADAHLFSSPNADALRTYLFGKSTTIAKPTLIPKLTGEKQEGKPLSFLQ